MQIVSVVDDSFQEYEGYHSLVLFCKGCNLRCEGCHNFYQIESGRVMGIGLDVINRRLNPMHEAVVFLGGEPTVWGDSLIESARFVKERGLRTKLFTNGMKPDVVKKLNSLGLMDAYSIDYKCVSNCSKILGVCMEDAAYTKTVEETLRLVIDAGKSLEIRTTAWFGADNVDGVRERVSRVFPEIKHIIQVDFRETVALAV